MTSHLSKANSLGLAVTPPSLLRLGIESSYLPGHKKLSSGKKRLSIMLIMNTDTIEAANKRKQQAW